jgi:hypothetical protein
MTEPISHTVDPGDEERHPPGAEQLWNESFYADFVSGGGELAGYVRLGIYPNLGVSWWTAMIVRPGQPLVAWTDYELPVPTAGVLRVGGRNSEISLHTEAPLEKLTIRAVGSGQVHDRPEAVYDAHGGKPVDVAIDLTWVTDGSPYHYVLTTRYEIPCLVQGRLTIGAEEFTIGGSGQRDHSWGVRDWWALAWCWASVRLEDGTRVHITDVRFPDRPAFGYVQSASHVESVSTLLVNEEIGDHGFPRSARIELEPGSLALTVHPLAFGPLLLTGPEGQLSRFPRALARYEADDGRQGLGWVEWNQPQGVR